MPKHQTILIIYGKVLNIIKDMHGNVLVKFVKKSQKTIDILEGI